MKELKLRFNLYKFMTKVYKFIEEKKNLIIGGLFFIAFIIALGSSWYENVYRFNEWKTKYEIRNDNNVKLIEDVLSNKNPQNINELINLNQISRNNDENTCIEIFNDKDSIEFEYYSTFVSTVKVLFLSDLEVRCYKSSTKKFVYTAYLMVVFSYTLAIFLLVFNIVRNSLKRQNHSVVIGLNPYSVELIKKLTHENIVKVYVQDKYNPFIDEVKDNGAIVITSNFEDELVENTNKFLCKYGIEKTSDIFNAKEIFIMNENDGITLNYLSQLVEEKNSDNFKYNPNIYVQIENRDNKIFFEKNGIFKLTHEKYKLFVFSLDEIITDKLFFNRPLTVNMDKNQEQELRVLIVGYNNLVDEILYYMLKLGHFAGGKPIEITIVNEKNDNLSLKFSEWIKIGLKNSLWNLKFKSLKNLYSKDFYINPLNKNFKFDRVILCDKETNKSVDLLSFLNRNFFSILKKKNILIQIHNIHSYLNKTIDKNDKNFKNYYTFGSVEDTCEPNVIRNNRMYDVAKFTNDFKEQEKVNGKWVPIKKKQWDNLENFTRESNITEKKHIQTRLHYLGLELIKSLDEQLDDYEKIQENYIKRFSNINEEIIEKIYESPYFKDVIKISSIEDIQKIIKSEEKTDEKLIILSAIDLLINLDEVYYETFEKRISDLARLEHTRWNAIHYLNGWSRKKDLGKNLVTKEHFDLCDWQTLLKEDPGVIKYDYKNVYHMSFVAYSLGYEIKKV